MTAAVPVPNTSSSRPLRCASTTSSIESWRSLALSPQSRSRVSTESRVTPGRMVPPSAGVITSSPIFTMMFMVPTSSMYLRCTPSSHSTWVKPSCLASSPAMRLAA